MASLAIGLVGGSETLGFILKIHTWVPLGDTLGSPGDSEAASIQRISGLEEELRPLTLLCPLRPCLSTMCGNPSFFSLRKSNSINFRTV